MKTLLPFIFLCFSISVFAQVNNVMPPEAYTFYNNAMAKIKPAIKNIIEIKARNLKGHHVNRDSLFAQLQNEPALKKSSRENVQAITLLTLILVSKNADSDLKNLVMNMQKNKPEETENGADESEVAKILANKSEIAQNVSIVMKSIPAGHEMLLESLK